MICWMAASSANKICKFVIFKIITLIIYKQKQKIVNLCFNLFVRAEHDYHSVGLAIFIHNMSARRGLCMFLFERVFLFNVEIIHL